MYSLVLNKKEERFFFFAVLASTSAWEILLPSRSSHPFYTPATSSVHRSVWLPPNPNSLREEKQKDKSANHIILIIYSTFSATFVGYHYAQGCCFFCVCCCYFLNKILNLCLNASHFLMSLSLSFWMHNPPLDVSVHLETNILYAFLS